MTSADLDALIDAFDDDRYVIADFGSGTSYERDIFILDVGTTFEAIEHSMNEYVERLTVSEVLQRAKVISRHEHRSLGNTNEPTLHLLFYPSLRHLVAWELPSFLCCIAMTSTFRRGTRALLEKYVNGYSHRTMQRSSASLYEHQQLAYDGIANSSLLYAVQTAPVYPRACITEELGYVTRFSLAEYFQEMKLLQLNAVAWSWEAIIEATARYLPERKAIRNVLRLARDHVLRLTDNAPHSMFMEYYSLRDYLATNVAKRNMP
ncbi:MAG TPA: hypothetical protein VIY90_21215 [Steroidobacteraceae bacterium]